MIILERCLSPIGCHHPRSGSDCLLGARCRPSTQHPPSFYFSVGEPYYTFAKPEMWYYWDLDLNSARECTNAAWNVTLLDCWLNFKFWQRRHDRCKLTSHGVQNKSLLARLQLMRLLAGGAKIQHTGVHNYKQPSRTFRQKCRILLLIPKIMLRKSETLGQRYHVLIYDLFRTWARLFRGQHVAEC